MNTDEINRKLRHVNGFVGVFPKNQLPVIRSCPASFVFNTDPASEPGKHWIAVLILEEQIEYFDATGRYPVITSYLKKHEKPVLFNHCRVQSPYSIACGLFCVDFILRSGESFCEIISSFSRNRLFNDFLLLR